MRLKIGQAFGIDVFLHWTFVLAPLYVIYQSRVGGDSWAMAALSLVVLLTMFGCILLHEFGHALAARMFNVGTKDIIITPVGGLARLMTMPRNPFQEFVITIAGPAVNLVIAILLAGFLFVSGTPLWPDMAAQGVIGRFGFAQIVLWLNVILFVFNLIPAFPMDGGRILRSVLAMIFGWQTATLVAGILGQLFGALFIVVGIYYGDFFLAFIGVFVLMAARAEVSYSRRAPVRPDQTATVTVPGIVIDSEVRDQVR